MPRRRVVPAEPGPDVIPLHIPGECYLCDIFHNLQGAEGIVYHQPIVRTVDRYGNVEYVTPRHDQPAAAFQPAGFVANMMELIIEFEWPMQMAVTGILLFGALFILAIVLYQQLFMWLVGLF